MRLLALVLPAVLGLVLVPSVASPADATSLSRVVDRTFACTTVATSGGRHDLDLVASPHTVQEYPGERTVVAAYLTVGSGVDSLDSDLVAARSAAQRGISRVLPAGAYAHVRKCAATRVTVPLSRKGIPGPPVRWYKPVACNVPRRVLVHLRAELEGSPPWRRLDSSYAGARGSLSEASIAIRSEQNAPIAYMQLTAGRNVALWYSPRCT